MILESRAAQSAIRLSAHVLSGDARELKYPELEQYIEHVSLAGQLTGRCLVKTPCILSRSSSFDEPRA